MQKQQKESFPPSDSFSKNMNCEIITGMFEAAQHDCDVFRAQLIDGFHEMNYYEYAKDIQLYVK